MIIIPSCKPSLMSEHGTFSGKFTFTVTLHIRQQGLMHSLEVVGMLRALGLRCGAGVLRCDKEGNFVIGSYNNNHRGDGADLGGLYRLNGQTKALTEILDYRFRCSNCICFSPDGQTMYFCDTPTRRIYSFDYSPQGKLRNRQLVYEMPSHMEGGPDGAQCDADGFLWAAISGAGRVRNLCFPLPLTWQSDAPLLARSLSQLF